MVIFFITITNEKMLAHLYYRVPLWGCRITNEKTNKESNKKNLQDLRRLVNFGANKKNNLR
jgi:hypothetical protein